MQTNLNLLKFKNLAGMENTSSGECRAGKYKVVFPNERAFYYEYRDIFEKGIYKFKTANKKPKIIDAGGYIGMATLYFKLLYPKAEIKVFEPDHFTFSFLKENIENNKIKNVTLYDFGLGKKDGIVSFYPDGGDGASSKIRNGEKKVNIKIKKLSDYISSPVDLLKINIEGAEYEVLQDIENKLKFVDQIILEYHCFYELPQTLGKILDILDRNSFKYAVSSPVGYIVGNPFNEGIKHKLFNLVYAKKI
jgi:FkbM family methyltransferase